MSEFLQEFVRESDEQITELNNALLRLEEAPDDEAALENIFRIAHTLKGNCGAMGFDAASDLAHAIEDLLAAVRAGDLAVTPDLMDDVFGAVDELETMIDEVDATGEVETDPSDAIAALRAHLEAADDGIEPPAADEIDALLSDLEPSLDDEQELYVARLAIAPDEAGANGDRVVAALVDAFDLLVTDPSREAIAADEYGSSFDAAFGSAVDESAIASGLEPVDEVADFELIVATARLDDPADDAGTTAPTVDEDAVEGVESVDELLASVDEFDDLDAMVEDLDENELEPFEEMGEAGSFDDLLEDESAAPEESTAGDEADSPADESDDVDDASAVFDELKDEVETVGFDELQDELDDLEFDEFDEEEVGMDELLGDDADGDVVSDDGDDPLGEVDEGVSDPEDEEPLEETDEESAAEDVGDGIETDDEAESVREEGDGSEGDDAVPSDESTTADDVVAAPPANGDLAADEELPADDGADAELAEGADAEPAAEADAESDDDAVALEEADDSSTGDDAVAASDAPDDESGGFGDWDADSTADWTTDDDASDDLEWEDATDERDRSDDDWEAAPEEDWTASADEWEADVPDRETEWTDEDGSWRDDVDATDPFADDGAALADDGLEAGSTADDGEGLDPEAADPDAESAVDSGAEETADGADVAADPDEDDASDALEDEGASILGDPTDDPLDLDDVPLDLGDVATDDAFEADFGEDVFDAFDEVDADLDDGFALEDASGFGDGDDSSEDDRDPERIVDEPDLASPDISIPETRDRPDADRGDDEIQSVRVDVEQVDSLLTLVEGLVTSRVRLRHAIESGEDREAIADELDDLEDLTTELQETVMDVRLVPLRTVAGRLPRVVRDVAREQGKEASLELRGEDVELDRRVLDRIGDPLTHLVRNAVDHGIEEPERRDAADKPEEGTVTVTADRSRGRVTITVEDDGCGLDPEELRSAGVGADVLSAEEAESLSTAEAHRLVFHPGLSTAAEVTDVSGRGVGMDVVKRTIDDLGGSVEIESEDGEGTRVTMTLPVSVAIDDVLFLEAGGEEFGVPAKVVKDIESAAALSTADGGLEDPDGSRSVVDLAEALETPGASANGDGMVVRVREGVRPIALRCDDVHGQQEVVVKPFEGVLSGVPGIGGATVRGRGAVVNILDVTTL